MDCLSAFLSFLSPLNVIRQSTHVRYQRRDAEKEVGEQKKLKYMNRLHFISINRKAYRRTYLDNDFIRAWLLAPPSTPQRMTTSVSGNKLSEHRSCWNMRIGVKGFLLFFFFLSLLIAYSTATLIAQERLLRDSSTLLNAILRSRSSLMYGISRVCECKEPS